MGVDSNLSCREETVPEEGLSLTSFPKHVVTFFGNDFLTKILDICKETQAASDLLTDGFNVDSLPNFLALWKDDTSHGIVKSLYDEFHLCITTAQTRSKKQTAGLDLRSQKRAAYRFGESMHGALTSLEQMLMKHNQVACILLADLVHLDWYNMQLELFQTIDSAIEVVHSANFLTHDQKKRAFMQSIVAHYANFAIGDIEKIGLSQMCSLWLCLPQKEDPPTNVEEVQRILLKTANAKLFSEIIQKAIVPNQSFVLSNAADELGVSGHSSFPNIIRFEFLNVSHVFNRIVCTLTLNSGEEIALSLSLLNGQLAIHNYGVYASLSPVFKAKNAGLIYEQWRNIILRCISDQIRNGELRTFQKVCTSESASAIPQDTEVHRTDVQETMEATQEAVNETVIAVNEVDDDENELQAVEPVQPQKTRINLKGIKRDEALAVLLRLGFTVEQGTRHLKLRHGEYSIAFPNQHKGNEGAVLKTLLAIFKNSPVNRAMFTAELGK